MLVAPSRRRSLLDRLDSPRAVFGVLGLAAIAGLALAFGVVRGLQHVGHRDVASGAARETIPKAAPARNEALAKTLAPELQYQALTSNSPAVTTPDRKVDEPSSPAAMAPEPQAVQPAMPASSPNTIEPVPPPSLGRLKLTAPYIPPIARTGRSMPVLARPPRAPLGPPPTAIALPAPATPLNTTRPSVATLPPPRIDIAQENRNAASVARTIDPGAARRLNEDANHAFWIRQDVAEALRLERRAFEANPADVEIAGNLAFYYLKQTPPHAEAAREAALHALSTPSRYRSGRLEDWMSLGVASALLGRRQDAENAFITSASIGNSVERACRGALNAVTTYGEAVRPAAIALLRRVNEQGRSRESPYCTWPPDWALGKRYP